MIGAIAEATDFLAVVCDFSGCHRHLYRCRWQIERFFKRVKQHLRIKSFFGFSGNAVKTQIWIAVAVYVLIAIVKKRLAVSASLYTILQLLSVTSSSSISCLPKVIPHSRSTWLITS